MAQPCTIPAADGYPLGATHYAVRGSERGRIVVAGATAVPQRFYRRFAEHAAAHGWSATTFDYRGIGASAPPSLRGFVADFLDWARRDLAAVADAVAVDAQGPLFLVGHSWGGHAFGLLPDPARFAGAWMFGVGTGWHGWMPPLERLRVQFLWRVAAPVLVLRHGYLAWCHLGMGEDLPLGVYRQWKRWCRHPRFFLDDPDMGALLLAMARVRTPIVAVNAADDRWAPPRSRDAFMAGYRAASWRALDVADLRLGHMGYFRPHAQPLWDAALAWFEGMSASRARTSDASVACPAGSSSAASTGSSNDCGDLQARR